MTDDKNLGRKAKTEHGILPGDLPTEKMLERFVRVDHAGEYGATLADAKAEAITYLDLVSTIERGNTTYRIGINNATDENPPYFHSNFNGNTEPGIYDVIGRRLFASVVLEF